MIEDEMVLMKIKEEQQGYCYDNNISRSESIFNCQATFSRELTSESAADV